MSGVIPIALVCAFLGLLGFVIAYTVGCNRTAQKIKSETKAQIDELHLASVLDQDARKQAENANIAKSAFLANMSHELRTPLNGILGLTDILKSEELTPGQLRKVDLINGSSETLLNLLNDILDISKIEAGSIDFEEIDIDLNSLLRKAYEFWRPISTKKDIDLVFQKQKNMPERIVCDPTKVRQCLDNLVSNAIKFTPENGKVVVKVTANHDLADLRVMFAVQDNGPGIEPENLIKLFKPFTQAEVDTSRKFGGTGLGLAISKNLCNLMGGDVVVRSKVGEGTTFKMSFLAQTSTEQTRREAEERKSELTAPQFSDLTGLRCLVVEDNQVNLEVLRLLLEPYTFNLFETNNGQEAISALNTQFFDVVLMDLQMPVLGGMEAARRIRGSRKHYSEIPIIAMTANAMKEDKKECIEIGFNAFLTKPLKRNELISTIEASLEATTRQNKNVA